MRIAGACCCVEVKQKSKNKNTIINKHNKRDNQAKLWKIDYFAPCQSGE